MAVYGLDLGRRSAGDPEAARRAIAAGNPVDWRLEASDFPARLTRVLSRPGFSQTLLWFSLERDSLTPPLWWATAVVLGAWCGNNPTDLEGWSRAAERITREQGLDREVSAGAVALAAAASFAASWGAGPSWGAALLIECGDATPQSQVYEGLLRARTITAAEPAAAAKLLGADRESTAATLAPFCIWIASRHQGDLLGAVNASAAAADPGLAGGLAAAIVIQTVPGHRRDSVDPGGWRRL